MRIDIFAYGLVLSFVVMMFVRFDPTAKRMLQRTWEGLAFLGFGLAAAMVGVFYTPDPIGFGATVASGLLIGLGTLIVIPDAALTKQFLDRRLPSFLLLILAVHFGILTAQNWREPWHILWSSFGSAWNLFWSLMSTAWHTFTNSIGYYQIGNGLATFGFGLATVLCFVITSKFVKPRSS